MPCIKPLAVASSKLDQFTKRLKFITPHVSGRPASLGTPHMLPYMPANQSTFYNTHLVERHDQWSTGCARSCSGQARGGMFRHRFASIERSQIHNPPVRRLFPLDIHDYSLIIALVCRGTWLGNNWSSIMSHYPAFCQPLYNSSSCRGCRSPIPEHAHGPLGCLLSKFLLLVRLLKETNLVLIFVNYSADKLDG
jgi:hypothetical protein